MTKSNTITKATVAHVVKLANLKLTPQELELFTRQLSQILEYVGQLEKVDTKNIQPIAQITGLENVERSDEPTTQPLTQEEVLFNASSTHNNLFKVKAILKESSDM